LMHVQNLKIGIWQKILVTFPAGHRPLSFGFLLAFICNYLASVWGERERKRTKAAALGVSKRPITDQTQYDPLCMTAVLPDNLIVPHTGESSVKNNFKFAFV
jgi:hypothetical protein